MVVGAAEGAASVTALEEVTGPVAVPSGPLSASVAELCDSVRGRLTPRSAERLDQVIGRLTGPLRLAVAGRIKSGKSTVVNALIGRRVAPTDIRECTRLVTRFQYGAVDRVEVVCVDGNRRTVPYDPEGLVPADLGVDTAEVAYVDAFLTSATLQSVTVIDTPGLGSLDRASSRRTEALLGVQGGDTGAGADLDAGSRAALARAEAVLFVLTQAVRADDSDALSAFHAFSTPRAASPVNAVAVLNKADLVNGDNPMVAARDLASAQARSLRHRVSDVLPLVGLVAEATEAGVFTEADALALRQIAALDPARRDLLFFSADLFVRPEIPVSVSARARLLEHLDLYGVRRAVDLILADPTLAAGELRRRLVAVSGFPVLRDVVDNAFRYRVDGIKASVALGALDMIAQRAPEPADRALIRDAVEDLLARPEANQLQLLEAAALATSGTVPLPDDMIDELTALIGGRDPAAQLAAPGQDVETLRGIALDRAARWRSFATFGSTPAQSRVAHVVHRGFFLLWQRLSGGAG